uniref:Uncharacterized protein n=1 Tax=Arundo donax TaxID=35708 RepID=A0A0A8ZH47_ARUDO
MQLTLFSLALDLFCLYLHKPLFSGSATEPYGSSLVRLFLRRSKLM